MKDSKFNIFPGIFLAGFIIIAYFVTKASVMDFDTAIQNFVFAHRTEALTSFFQGVTHTGDWPVITALCIFLLLFPGTRKTYGLPLTCTAIGGTVLYKILKYIFQRPRPDQVFHLISQGGFSFPSGHSLTIMLVYGVLILLLRRDFLTKNKAVTNGLTAAISCYIFLIGFSRIYVGVHYPTDVLGGWLLSLFILWIVKPFLTYKEEL